MLMMAVWMPSWLMCQFQEKNISNASTECTTPDAWHMSRAYGQL